MTVLSAVITAAYSQPWYRTSWSGLPVTEGRARTIRPLISLLPALELGVASLEYRMLGTPGPTGTGWVGFTSKFWISGSPTPPVMRSNSCPRLGLR